MKFLLQNRLRYVKIKLYFSTDFKLKMEIVVKNSSSEFIQPFKGKSAEFLKNATQKIQKENSKLSTSKMGFFKMLKFYKFIPKTGTRKDCTPNQFFELWTTFVCDLKNIYDKEMSLMKF